MPVLHQAQEDEARMSRFFHIEPQERADYERNQAAWEAAGRDPRTEPRIPLGMALETLHKLGATITIFPDGKCKLVRIAGGAEVVVWIDGNGANVPMPEGW